jgi:hypothetical protein
MVFYINHLVPWCYLAAAVDWTEDVLQKNSACYTWGKYYRNDFSRIIGVIADRFKSLSIYYAISSK